jgi:signal transduction histidine kinase
VATVGVVDVDEVVASALDRSRSSGRATPRQPDHERRPGGCAIRGSRDQLVTALLNLLHNAIHYSDTKARVVVTTALDSRAGRRARRHRVSDNGIGIARLISAHLRAVLPGRLRPQPRRPAAPGWACRS